MALALVVVVAVPMRVGAEVPVRVAGNRDGCKPYLALQEKIELTTDGQLTIPPLRAWAMPRNPTWRENPFRDVAWLVRYQSLRYIEHLIKAWCETGAQKPLNRARFLMLDWLRDNPQGAAGPRAWYDHAVAWRTFVLIKAVGVMPDQQWLRPAIEAHALWLIRHDDGVGNHALNVNRALLAAGCFARRQDWIDSAVAHIDKLVRQSVDIQGVTNEQAIAYQAYNYQIYSQARKELLDCGQPESPDFARIGRMPNMLAFATLPNGEYEMLGDTAPVAATVIPGTWAEFAATKGASGPKPPSTDAVYERGFAFVRSGWGETRLYEDEVMLSLRFGAGRLFHGHDDGGSMTLYGLGSRLVLDSGKNSFQGGKPWTPYFVGRSAHNVITVDGLSYARDTYTSMSYDRDDRSATFVLRNDGYTGVSNTRSVLYSRRGHYVIVADQLTSADFHTFRQLWHLRNGASPTAADGDVATTADDGGNVKIVQLLSGTTRFVTASDDPVQGWLTVRYQKVIAAPTVEEIKNGTSVRYLTVLIPFRGSVSVSGTIDALYSDGYQVDITVNGKTERWTVHGTSASVYDTIPLPRPTGEGSSSGTSESLGEIHSGLVAA